MSDDPLDKNVSVGAELTPTGLNLNAKSRFVAAFDRLCGNAVDLVNVPMERRLTKGRAEIEGQKQLIEAMTKAAVDRMATDPEFAERAIRNHLGLSVERQANKDGVVRHAVEDLRRNSVAEEAGPKKLDPAFVSKFERHAEDASTEELREKWGRVLGAEIRQPGTVTPRVMRIVDEIDTATAQLFETLCRSKLGNVIPCCLSGALDVITISRLVGSGLLVDPGFTGQLRLFGEVSDHSGRKAWLAEFGRHAISIPRQAIVNVSPNSTNAIQLHGEIPAVPVYILTAEGLSLSQILPDLQEEALRALVRRIRSLLPNLPMTVFKKGEAVSADASIWHPLYEVPTTGV